MSQEHVEHEGRGGGVEALVGALRAAQAGGEHEQEEAKRAARRCGIAAAEEGDGIDELLGGLLRATRPLIARGVDPSAPGAPGAGTTLAEEAIAVAAASWARAHEARREAWLSYLTHEVKNPLNTVLNSLWLLREHPGAPNTGRFLEMAERGVRRIEALLKDLRALHRRAEGPPPVAERLLGVDPLDDPAG